MKQAIYEMVRQRDWVSCVELCEIDGVKGDTGVEIADKNILCLWGLSDEAIEAIRQLCIEEKICLRPGTLLSYLVDGACLTLPIAKRIPKNGYKTRRWMPTFFCRYRHDAPRLRLFELDRVRHPEAEGAV